MVKASLILLLSGFVVTSPALAQGRGWNQFVMAGLISYERVGTFLPKGARA